MTSTSDPLYVLRDWVKEGKLPKLEGSRVIVADLSYEVTAETAYKMTPSQGRRPDDADKFYTIGTLAALILCKETQYIQYLRKLLKDFSNQRGIELVTSNDYKDLLDFLSGITTTSARIEESRLNKLLPQARVTAIPEVGAKRSLLELVEAKELKRKSLGSKCFEDLEFIELDKQIVAGVMNKEFVAISRHSLLSAPGQVFKDALDALEPMIKTDKEGGSANDSKRRPDGRSLIPDKLSTVPKPPPIDIPRGDPIIIVSGGDQSLLNMRNIQEFLDKGQYVSAQEKLREGKDRTKELPVSRTLSNGNTVRFKITDNPLRFRPEDWNLVVAVFAEGQTWQFRKWKYEEPVDLFAHCFGAHFYFEDEVPSGSLKSWNVRLYKISKSKRHLDAPAVAQFWMNFEEWARVHKPWVLLKKKNQ